MEHFRVQALEGIHSRWQAQHSVAPNLWLPCLVDEVNVVHVLNPHTMSKSILAVDCQGSFPFFSFMFCFSFSDLEGCSLTDDDLGDVATCFDDFDREDIAKV